MKKTLLSLFFFYAALSFSSAQTLSLKELTDFFEWNDTTKIDKVMAKKDWVYMSSEIENGDQVDIWMKEKHQGHIVQAMFVLVSNPKKPGKANNQATLHLLNVQFFGDLQAQASEAGFEFFKQIKPSEKMQADYWRNEKYLLVFTTDRESQLPYKVMIAHAAKK
jgi:hypothetical protein